MGIFSRRLENKLLQMYVQLFTNIGMSRIQAVPIVKNMLKMAKENSIKEKTNNLPPNFGDLIIENAESYLESGDLIEKPRKEGATDNDIRGWWNMYDLERHMIQQYDNHSRMVSFLNEMESGKNGEEAGAGIRKIFPMYGDSDDISKTKGVDRPLPYELKDRVNKYMESIQRQDPNGKEFKKKMELYSTVNALIRDEIRKGNI